MTVVSSKEFSIHQEKYFEMAIDEQVFIQKGDNIFLLICKNTDDMNIYHEESVYNEVLEPDEDFNRALSSEDFRKRLVVVLDGIDKKYANRCK